ncbi:hypothetical protein TRFO_23101 [Tritrichomonas foetus]|uniref:Uncharacterized protein n=1 Tax=Tritrichomonas foetus TaxID=1144522 RepID=A0A1J4KAF4_9EUKA|nr:hypothetical protein TRFO_23101 [Tritrichomonas foetus]|eukprot:OHT08417.1 hypothetical protein TRFO_23101 [Tritrichomonas foetus]
MSVRSTQFTNFLMSPLAFNRDSSQYLYECREISQKSTVSDGSIVFVRHCIFDKCSAFFEITAATVNIETSVFKESGAGNDYGIQITSYSHDACSISISNTSFFQNDFKNLFYVNNFSFFSLKYSEVNGNKCDTCFNIKPASKYALNVIFCNFLNSQSTSTGSSAKYPTLFEGVNTITIEKSYFSNVQVVMPYVETPQGNLASAFIIDCSLEGAKPEGIDGNFIVTSGATKIPINTILTPDCEALPTLNIVWPTRSPPPTQTPSASASPSVSMSPSPSDSPSVSMTPVATPSTIPHQTGVATASPDATFSPSASPEATQSPSPSFSPMQTPSQSPSASVSASASMSPEQTPPMSPMATSTPKPTPNVPLILEIVIPLAIALIVIPIILYKCIRKIQDMLSDDDYDMGVRLQFHTDGDDSQTTSDRSNPLALDSESFDGDNTDDEQDFFNVRPRRRDVLFLHAKENYSETTSSSTL